ncbi:MAG: gliding motility lipoprotein GldH [Saprospiraceae bacterium]|nr:gliding motility lipoprotein GldH [Saprospiraceae bacterium]
MRTALILFILAVGLSACHSDILFEEKINLPVVGWTVADSVKYQLAIEDTAQNYDMVLRVDALDSYRYQNLYVMINTLFPDGKLEKDVVSLEVSTSGGEWHGKCSSDHCAVPILIQENFRFPKKGNYTITVAQHSRLDTIKGIEALQLSIAKVGK